MSALQLALTWVCADAAVVEIALIDKLDEPRGFCLDIVGSQRRAIPARGLQAHTCYSYQGSIAADQGFDSDALKAGELRLPWFQVCVTGQPRQNSALMLQSCDGSPAQQFRFTQEAQIVPNSDTTLCATVSSAPSALGGGGKPPHLIRSLSLQPCAANLDKFQKWRIREKATD